MSKRLHPIRKLLDGLYRAGMAPPFDPADLEPVVARYVKPLLAALEEQHGLPFPHGKGKDCSVCCLLAAWKEPLK